MVTIRKVYKESENFIIRISNFFLCVFGFFSIFYISPLKTLVSEVLDTQNIETVYADVPVSSCGDSGCVDGSGCAGACADGSAGSCSCDDGGGCASCTG